MIGNINSLILFLYKKRLTIRAIDMANKFARAPFNKKDNKYNIMGTHSKIFTYLFLLLDCQWNKKNKHDN